MRTIRIKRPSTDGAERARPGPGRDLLPLLAGAATAVGGFGALLALTDSGSPLRGPLTLFFLLAAPATAIGVALRGLERLGWLSNDTVNDVTPAMPWGAKDMERVALQMDAGYSATWEPRLLRNLDQRPELKRVYVNDDAIIYALKKQPEGKVPKPVPWVSPPLSGRVLIRGTISASAAMPTPSSAVRRHHSVRPAPEFHS